MSAEVEQLALDVLVAPPHVMDTADGRAAVGRQGAKDERGTGPQVTHLEVPGTEVRGARDGRVMGVGDLDPCAHVAQVSEPFEAVLEDRFVDRAAPIRLGKQHRSGRLEIRG